MTKLVLGWSLVLVGAVAGCTTTVHGGSETGGGIQEPEENVIVPSGSSTSTGTPPVQASSTSTDGAGGATGGGGAPPSTDWGDLPGPPDLGGVHRPPACDAGEQIVLATFADQILVFDPATETATLQATSQCGGIGSMAMTETGALVATTLEEELVAIDPMIGDCDVLTEVHRAPGMKRFVIGFVANASGPGGQVTAMSMHYPDEPVPLLAEVDPQTGAMSVVSETHPGLIQTILSTGVGARINGVAFPFNRPMLAVELDVTTAEVLWTVPIPPPPVFGNRMATARWGDYVYVFWGHDVAGTTVMTRLDLATGLSAPWTPLEGGAVLAAGTPPCAIPR